MKILSMTATFGKLNHQTLTLKPGLNIIEAPNEWGKSTWCAFLTAMLYGIDTSQQTTMTVLADKEHYAPWSGQPMSGRLEISWDGRNITIERSTKGRTPMGKFSAYETDSGLPVPELTADNCGQMLLGVERSVFLRAGFIRQTDMPVVQDEALRRRLNALVTTGDENDAADQLTKKLKDLKNRCRHNKTGALPQAEAQRDQLTASLNRLSALRQQLEQLNQRQTAGQQQLEALKNHQQALAYERSMEGLYRLTVARDARKSAEERVQQLQAQTAQLPDAQSLTEKLAKLRQLEAEKASLEAQPQPDQGYSHQLFGDKAPEAALEQTRQDKAAYDKTLGRGPIWLLILAALFLVAIPFVLSLWIYGHLPLILLSVLCGTLYVLKLQEKRKAREEISARYGTVSPDLWVSIAEQYVQQDTAAKAVCEANRKRLALVAQLLSAHCQGAAPESAEKNWQDGLALHKELEQAQQAARQAAIREMDLEASVKPVTPAAPDTLTLTELETDRQIAAVTAQLQQLQLQAGQCMGQIHALGHEDALRQQLEAVEARIAKLSDLYEATVLALAHLEQAALQLQQRFAPQLTAEATALFSKLTGGRYDRLQLDQQLRLQAGAGNEDGLRPARWRSDGTMDQLYLALRLAVAQQLTPEAPLVLDDVLVRFDDTRHSAAMEVLRDLAEDKQVLLFTCQTREGAYSPESIIEI